MMLRNAVRIFLLRPNSGLRGVRCISSKSYGSPFRDEASLHAAREWITNFNVDSIPRNKCSITFSRSSGPGGQNVNKVNSKATLRLPLPVLLPLIPSALHEQIRDSRYYSSSNDSITVQADSSRKQGDNVDECFRKICDMITAVGRSAIPGVTSDTQKARVQKLQSANKQRRLLEKKIQSSKKSSRRSSGGPDY